MVVALDLALDLAAPPPLDQRLTRPDPVDLPRWIARLPHQPLATRRHSMSPSAACNLDPGALIAETPPRARGRLAI
jgi:hypothetical protein